MRTDMQRTITTSTIKYATTMVSDGKVIVKEHEPITVTGKVPEKQAHKHITDKNPLITSIEYTETLYTMSLETFLQYATKIESEDK